MKKFLIMLLGVLIGLPALAFTYEYEGQTLNYMVDSEEAKTALVYKNRSFAGDLIIPETVYDGDIAYTVTGIDNGAFLNCSTLTSVTLPNTLKTINFQSFQSCTGLTTVVIPNSVTYIGEAAFYNCSNLASVTLGESVAAISRDAFEGCSNLNTLYHNAKNCKFASLDFDEAGNEIWFPLDYDRALVYSPFPANLKQLMIGESVNTIDSNLFHKSELVAIYINSQAIAAQDNIFWNEDNCNPVVFVSENLECNRSDALRYDPETESGIEVLEDGSVVTQGGKILIYAAVKEDNVYTIPDGIETISSGAFKSAANMTQLTIPTSVKNVEKNAFANCNNIVRVNFADWSQWYQNVTLGNFEANPYRNGAAYAGGIKITTPELTEGMTEIKDFVNVGLEFTGEVILPSTLKRIGAYSFYKNQQLYTIILPEGLEEIGESAFSECILLENIEFPSTLKKIEDGAFYGCMLITEVKLPEGLTVLGSTPEEMYIPDDYASDPYSWRYQYDTYRKKGVFEGCSSLEKAVIMCDIDYLSDNLFRNCGTLNKVFLPLNLKKIGAFAFSWCGVLEEVTFPSTLESIAAFAFESGALTKVVIPNNVTKLGVCAFYENSVTNLTLGRGLETISGYAFYKNPLNIINFSEGLKTIENSAFAGIKNASTSLVKLPSSLTTIEENAFSDRNIM